MIDVYHQTGLILKYFGDLFEDSEKLAENIHSTQGDANSAFYDVFYREYPLRSRNTGLRIKIIRHSEPHLETIVELTNNKAEHIIYKLGVGYDGVSRHVTLP